MVRIPSRFDGSYVIAISNLLLQQTPMHGVVIKWCCQPRFIFTMSWFSAGGTPTAKRPSMAAIVGRGTTYSNTICRNGPGGPVVVGDHFRRDIP